MISKEDIIKEIKRTAAENGGFPLGTYRFENEIGIHPHEWEKYWARFGDAQKEAGFTANQPTEAYDDEFLFQKLIGVIQKLGRFPTTREIGIEKNNSDLEMPSLKAFRRLGNRQQLIEKLIEYCKSKNENNDIITLCLPLLNEPHKKLVFDGNQINEQVGEVYLFKSGKYYKIGMSRDTVRRGRELSIKLPEKSNMIHLIKTDDPSGVESYWHKRFESKQMNGEWFDLTSSDIKAFKRWKRIY